MLSSKERTGRAGTTQIVRCTPPVNHEVNLLTIEPLLALMLSEAGVPLLSTVTEQYWFGARPPAADGSAPADGGTERTLDLPEEAWLTTLLHEAGVPILAGTDAGVPFSLPGWSLHEELELLVAAGLTPAEVLEAATRGPAEYLGRADELSTIEIGRRADLVLLRRDPLEHIRNTRAIEAVILDGELLDREALDAVLADVRARAEGR